MKIVVIGGSRNLLAAEAAAGVGHHVALSVAGTERLQHSGYFRAKSAQEKLIETALATHDDPRTVVMDPRAGYFGAELGERTLLPGADAILGKTRYGEWLGRTSFGK